ncbi:MAG TPA: BatA domain-containing protein [Planctomycetaceae bacterium]|nr:BatA domain-containing protein [Planctomycetaceae bacterium]
MSFLQPAMLFALPLIALPIVIHLINQYRYRTIEWAAMFFLLTANKMSRGYARIRQWLILLMRTLAVAGLIFAISRPLASGWMRLAAPGNIDTTIILLDRSPSMQQQGTRTGMTKLDSARQQLVQSLSLLKSNRWVLIDSANNSPIELESPEALESILEAEPASASADIPAMLETVHNYLRDNRPSRTEVWLCSDLRLHDWDSESSRWDVLRKAFLESPNPVWFHLLAYASSDSRNRSVRVTSTAVQETSTGRELLISLKIERATSSEETERLPVRLEINGTSTEIPMEISGSETELKNYSFALEGQPSKGWGRVTIPADSNADDNEFYFVYDEPPPRTTVVVSDDPRGVKALELAAGISANPSLTLSVSVVSPHLVLDTDWDQVALLLWDAPLPDAETAPIVQSLVDRGAQVVFFPPESDDEGTFANLSWGSWEQPDSELQVSTWIQDQDLLANVQSGAALPVGDLKISRYRALDGERTTLATLSGGDPLLCRAVTDLRNVYFCTTRPVFGDSTLASDGVVLYVMIQRALASGATSLGSVRQLNAGEIDPGTTSDWRPLSRSDRTLSTTFGYQAGAYGIEERLFAVNRSAEEDRPTIVDDDRVSALFRDLPFDRVDDEVGSGSVLLREIWPTFLLIMMLMLIAEAMLCLPRRLAKTDAPAPFAKGVAA